MQVIGKGEGVITNYDSRHGPCPLGGHYLILPQEEKYNVHYKMISLCQAFVIKAVKTQGKGWLNQHGGVTKES